MTKILGLIVKRVRKPVKGTAGVGFTATPMKNVLQMDKLDDTQVVLMQKKENGDVDLWTANESAL